MLTEWDKLPESMKTEEVKYYYNILKSKKISLQVKRFFDVCASVGLLAFLSPVFAVISALIASESDGGIFFRQERITQNGRKFRIHKFRTMVKDADKKGSLITTVNDSRITKVGAFLRKYRLDELPQLIDVLNGDMTFVGTRPEVEKYVEGYTDEMKSTLLLPAGITSEASIRFKNEADLLYVSDDTDSFYMNEILPLKMKYNLNSIRNFSLRRDASTMIKTVLTVAGKCSVREKPLVALLTNNDDDIYCFRKELLEAFDAENMQLLISCPYGEKFKFMNHLEFIYDNPEIDRRGMNPIADVRLFLHYLHLFSKFKPDVILTYTAKPNVYGSIAGHIIGIPVINNVTGFGSVLTKDDITQKFIMSLFKCAYRKSYCVMFQNSANMKLAEKIGMIKGRYELIPGSGVNTERFPLLDYPDGGDGKKGKPVVFNYIGRILHDKGVDDYIEAAKRIKSEYPKTQFNMIGFIEPTESHYESELSELEKRGIISYKGSQPDVKPFIASSHATIHPSTYGEGMSNVLLESAASGRPVITTDNPGCRETLIENETGFLYHGGDVDELCEKIKEFLSLDNEKRKSMGEKGRQYVKENFSRDIVVKAYLEKINEIVN